LASLLFHLCKAPFGNFVLGLASEKKLHKGFSIVFWTHRSQVVWVCVTAFICISNNSDESPNAQKGSRCL